MKRALLFDLTGCIVLLFFCLKQICAQEYFQQEVNYTIQVTLNDTSHELSAYVSIEYTNNSPDSLKEIFFHLWPNAYANNKTALGVQLVEMRMTGFYYSKKNERGYIDQLDFKVNNKKIEWKTDSNHIDVCKLILNDPLPGGGKIIISTPFIVKLPDSKFSRLGHKKQAYYITQWYPKPAVYDKFGWHAFPYLSRGEFYSEFGSYDVYITLPKNYVIAATGDLVDNEKELTWLHEKAKRTKAKEEFIESKWDFPASDPETKTLHYHQDNVHDFAWFADKRFNVLKGELTLPHSKRKVTSWAMFTDTEADLWKKSIEYINDAVFNYSLWIGDYPYNNVTAVQTPYTFGTGMEYPNITIIGVSDNRAILEYIIMHEVGHNWFYGILGSNEREFPWMDEGFNSFYENRYNETKYPERSILNSYFPDFVFDNLFDLGSFRTRYLYYISYLYSASNHIDQPINLHSEEYRMINYTSMVYHKPVVAFTYLRSYLGEKVFDKAMKQYFEKWKYKHPYPNDFRKIMEDVSGKNLNWFFDDLIATTSKIDYKIKSVKIEKENTINIKIKNNGQINSPFSISGLKNDSIISTQWYEGFKGKQIFQFHAGNFDKYKIDANYNIPEIKRKNNSYKAKGILRKTEPLDIQFLWSIDNPNKTQIYYSPAIGWNNYNKFMMGIAVYNNPVFPKKIDYVIMPLYSFKTKNLNGAFRTGLNLFPTNYFINHIWFGVSGKQYNIKGNNSVQFQKLAPEINIVFKNNNVKKPIKKNLKITHVRIRNSPVLYESKNIYFSDYKYSDEGYISYNINKVAYSYINNRKINPFSFNIVFNLGNEFFKYFAEYKHHIFYNKPNKGINIRLFWGQQTNYSPLNLDFQLSGLTGLQDYFYDNTFLGRNENNGVFSQQFFEKDGGFKILTPIGQASEWLAAINIKSSIPLNIPIEIFVDIGTYNYSHTIYYDAGLELKVINNIFEIYFPLAMSMEMEDWCKSNYNDYLERVRFTLYLNKCNPFELLKNINL